MNLIESLKEVDGKRASAFEQLSASIPRADVSTARLLAAAAHDDTAIQVGATWILKRWLEEGVPEVERSAAKLAGLLNHATHWESRLHLLQMLTSLRIPATSLPGLRMSLPNLLKDGNKFVRAWALSVLANIADQWCEFREDAMSRIQDAQNDDAASVRARVRQIQKRYKWMRDWPGGALNGSRR
jgi:hypothetical protein